MDNLDRASELYEKLKDSIGILANSIVTESDISDAYDALKDFKEHAALMAVLIDTKLQNRPVDHLIMLQRELGYEAGEISPVALLGLFGEAGEVLAESRLFDKFNNSIIQAEKIKEMAVDMAEIIERLKKKIRREQLPGISVRLYKVKNEAASDIIDFDRELADTFYYLNILATQRGLTLDSLAEMAIAKVKAKQAVKDFSA